MRRAIVGIRARHVLCVVALGGCVTAGTSPPSSSLPPSTETAPVPVVEVQRPPTTESTPDVVAAPELPRADSPERVREAMVSRGPEVRRCYTRELRNQPDLRGRMLVQFTVKPDGVIEQVRIRADTVRSVRVRNCVAHVIASLRFAPGAHGRVQYRYPFVFAPE